jgi:hypothetical protein
MLAKDLLQDIVYVGTFTMDYFSEKPLPCHIKRKQLKKIIAAIFHHHAVLTGLLGCFYELPALINSYGCRNFNADMFPMLHGI